MCKRADPRTPAREEKCRDCRGKSICAHQRERSKCTDCGGKSISEHQRKKSSISTRDDLTPEKSG